MLEIPNKRYFKIGEVSKLTGVEPHTIRYWETEFPQLKPVRAGSRQRLYRRQDVDLLMRIRQLLHQEKYTIAGAQKKLSQEKEVPPPAAGDDHPSLFPDLKAGPSEAERRMLIAVRDELKDILKLLS